MAPFVVPADPAVPTDTLLGSGSTELLAAAVAAGGGELRGRPMARQTTYEPGRSLTVRYDATIAWPDGRVASEMLVAESSRHLPAGALVLDDGTARIAVWRVPADPRLTGLAAALDPDRLRHLFADLGAPVVQATPRLRAYRPGRRAVVEVIAPGARMFLKVVRPERAEALHRRHQLVSAAAPVPRSLGWAPELGIVALQAVGGQTVRRALETGRPAPSAGTLLALLDDLPDPAELAGPRREASTARFAALIVAVAPELGDRVGALAARLAEAETALEDEALVPVHGDLHEAQILTDGGRVTGLLDVDTFGVGHRVDDLATMIGHLSTLALVSPRRKAIERYGASLLDAFDRTVDPVLLRHSIAAVVLGMASGPFRVLEAGWRQATARRVLLAERWLASANRVERQLATT